MLNCVIVWSFLVCSFSFVHWQNVWTKEKGRGLSSYSFRTTLRVFRSTSSNIDFSLIVITLTGNRLNFDCIYSRNNHVWVGAIPTFRFRSKKRRNQNQERIGTSIRKNRKANRKMNWKRIIITICTIEGQEAVIHHKDIETKVKKFMEKASKAWNCRPYIPWTFGINAISSICSSNRSTVHFYDSYLANSRWERNTTR